MSMDWILSDHLEQVAWGLVIPTSPVLRSSLGKKKKGFLGLYTFWRCYTPCVSAYGQLWEVLWEKTCLNHNNVCVCVWSPSFSGILINHPPFTVCTLETGLSSSSDFYGGWDGPWVSGLDLKQCFPSLIYVSDLPGVCLICSLCAILWDFYLNQSTNFF